jgi:aminoglycoside phosphotransferase (APT) family kinase protein
MRAVRSDVEASDQLRKELDPLCEYGCVFTREPTRIEGGFSSELFGFQLDRAPRGLAGPLVLRLQSDDATAEREQLVHAGVAALGFATPAVVLTGDSSSAFGRPYTIMERLDGSPAVELSGLAALRAFRDAPALVADTMSELHALDASAVVARLFRVGIGDQELGVDAVLGEIDAAVDADPSREALDRLRVTRPRVGRPVVVHGDLHALNLWRLPDGTVALLDWELATIGPAELDVARSALILSLVPGEISRVVRPIVMRMGRRAAQSFTTAYRRQRPVDDTALRWCTGLHALRLLTVVLARSDDDRVAGNWRPLGRHLADIVAEVTSVRVRVPVPRSGR